MTLRSRLAINAAFAVLSPQPSPSRSPLIATPSVRLQPDLFTFASHSLVNSDRVGSSTRGGGRLGIKILPELRPPPTRLDTQDYIFFRIPQAVIYRKATQEAVSAGKYAQFDCRAAENLRRQGAQSFRR